MTVNLELIQSYPILISKPNTLRNISDHSTVGFKPSLISFEKQPALIAQISDSNWHEIHVRDMKKTSGSQDKQVASKWKQS